ncbi:MAG: DUF305 domain-containing protein [Mesorhizobium sp.]|uniref:DUF305 domain-containing protein n=1 Tax=unclassified Mesorhizobium TaxID=325217 RepID=UPI000FE80AC4|nr:MULTISPECIES: DUF305 domain-containing protein [unclassified Mesorhizobium]RWB32411.1 MAG: DUF305 domain-containing protein [Mesorhizobium sp.]RWB80772.1 MAG: DUF305 domain-containing protein [Mesorhizobium sp.]RWC11697.1 MAG: DUF305 domain-containing protein [Mesorhizobium sp.]RWD20270.1 MAG: DUF305 domain-containing protein [Mesorhizobium sp.]TGT99037.1 DUF305 domain-containing protein [Mesorhizobium sp. M5C.F.Ca.ET.164.01.1.1]
MKHVQDHETRGSYLALMLELAVDFVIMYLVMYTMIATLDHFYLNINNVYMTLMMVAPMAIVMLVAMRSMFPSRRMNLVVVAITAVIFVASFAAMRSQAAVDDEEFLRSMIPHHSGAILMCEQASLADREIVELCEGIVQSQMEEIARMQAILKRY